MSEIIGSSMFLLRETGNKDDNDLGITITGQEYMRRREAELGPANPSGQNYDSLEELRESEDFTLAQDYILFNKNGFDSSLLDPEIVKAAYWDAMAKHPKHLSDEAKKRAGEIIRSANSGKRERDQALQTNGRKVGSIALKEALWKGRDAASVAWMKKSFCLDADPEAFFPDKGGSTREAKRICANCTVSEECLEYALGNDERFGVWGELSERERRRLRKLAEKAKPELKKAS